MSTEEQKPAVVNPAPKMSLWNYAEQITNPELLNLDEVQIEEFRDRYLSKVENVVSYREFIELLITQRKEKIRKHKEELERLENHLEAFDNRIKTTMTYFGIERLSGHEPEISWGRLNTAAIVPDREPTKEESENPDTKDFVRVKIPPPKYEWDKDAIKTAHLANAPCPIEGTGVDKYRNLKFDIKKGPKK